MTNEEMIEFIEQYFAEEWDEEVRSISPYDCGTFYVETESERDYIVGDEESCRQLAIQNTIDIIDDVFDNESLLNLLDKTDYNYVDDRVLDVVLELYDPEEEMPELYDLEYFYEFVKETGLSFTDLMDYGLDADMIKPYIDYHGLSSYIVDEDGIANTLASYDGDENWLGEDLYAYRRN